MKHRCNDVEPEPERRDAAGVVAGCQKAVEFLPALNDGADEVRRSVCCYTCSPALVSGGVSRPASPERADSRPSSEADPFDLGGVE